MNTSPSAIFTTPPTDVISLVMTRTQAMMLITASMVPLAIARGNNAESMFAYHHWTQVVRAMSLSENAQLDRLLMNTLRTIACPACGTFHAS